MRAFRRLATGAAVGLSLLYAVDRLAKLLATEHFLRRADPPPPPIWPPVTMLHPITRATEGRSALAANLRACARLDYPAPLRHVLICDAADAESLAIARAFRAAYPGRACDLVIVPAGPGPIAAKIAKLQAGLAGAGVPPEAGAVLCLIDDDIAPRPDALRRLVAALGAGGRAIGATFGLPCYTNWRTPWSSLLGLFNNANFLLATTALTYLSEPPRITGHLVAYRWGTFAAAGGLAGLEDQIDDDFALARRLGARGARVVQTPILYDVDNDLAGWATFARQLRRWFVLPRQAMAAELTPREALTGLLVSAGLLLPPGAAALALLARTRAAWGALAGCLGLFGLVALACERRYLRNPAPLPARRWPLLPVVALALPVQSAAALLLGRDEIEWRGQRLRVAAGGRFERLP